MNHDDLLFSVTLYRDATLRFTGHGRREALPDILRMIALSIEHGATILDDEFTDLNED